MTRMNVYAANPRRNGGQISRSTDRVTSRTEETYQLSTISRLVQLTAPRYVKSASAERQLSRTTRTSHNAGGYYAKSADDPGSGRGHGFKERSRVAARPSLATLHNISYRTF